MNVANSELITIQVPASLLRAIEEVGAREGFSAEQFIASAAGEKLSVWFSMKPLKQAAAEDRIGDLKRYLAAVPDVEPIETDRLPEIPRTPATSVSVHV